MSFNFCSELERGCRKLGLCLDNETMPALESYFHELKKWSQKVNLIAKGTSDIDIVENHFIDSLALIAHLPAGAGLLDIGTGAGLPGLICKAARPDLKLFLVEPRVKRVHFLRHIVRTLALDGVVILAERVEDVPQLFAEKAITHITSRAVSDMAGFIEMTKPFVGEVTRLALKGARWQEEQREAEPLLVDAGYKIESVTEYSLPFSGAERAIVAIR